MQKNLLDFIPKHNSLITFTTDKKGIVTLEVKNRGFYNRIAQIFFKRPKVSYIALEEMGSFIWQQIDGEKTVMEIGEKVKEHFGQKAEPLYERLGQYINTLRRCDYILFTN
ncbi:MAG: PqqD family protein [Treponema sp.]|nr:PqqD family protein [Treponema sp.]